MLECYDGDSEQEVYHFINVPDSSFEVSVEVQVKALSMLIDTGAAAAAIPEHIYDSHFAHIACQRTKVSLFRYTGEQTALQGQM